MFLESFCTYLKDLLTFDETKIIIGRENFNVRNLETNFIFVDVLGSIETLSKTVNFDGEAEQETFVNYKQATMTLNFTGLSAYQNATKFELLQKSQKSYELQRNLQLNILHVSKKTNLKTLLASMFHDNYELELKIQFTESLQINTLRIDTAQVELLTD